MGTSMLRAISAVALLSVFLPFAAAQERAPVSWDVTFENDKWGAGTDRHYTHGTHVTRRSTQTPAWLRRAAAPLRCLACTGPRTFELRVGQEIYTPENTWSTELVTDDRPYAGWSYGEIALQGERTVTGARRVGFDEIALELGVVGPASLADRTQELLHREKNVEMPRGWSHQLENELGAVLTYTRGVRFPLGQGGSGLGHDVSPYVVGALGTVRTQVGGGLRLRSGRNLSGAEANGWHVFLDLRSVWVGRDLLLDGNSSGASHSVRREPVVSRVSGGLEYRGDRFRLSLARERRSAEFIGQLGPDEYGSVGFAVSR
jgi:lipid A 3-O-deacylase